MYKTVIENKGPITKKVNWNQTYVELAFWFTKYDSEFTSAQTVSLSRTTSFEDISTGKLKKPAQIQVETIAIVRILLE